MINHIDKSHKSAAYVKKADVVDMGLREYMLSVYIYMTMALLVTGISAFVTMNVDPIVRLMFKFSEYGHITGNTLFGILVMFSPIGIAWYFHSKVMQISIEQSNTMLWIYAGLVGMSLLGFVYTGTSIVRTFLICASMFGGMSIYGYTTKRDLTSMGSFLTMGIVGLFLASLVNLFFFSSAVYFVTSILGIVIFTGLVAWDAQRIKSIYFTVGNGEIGKKMAVVGAFSLYLNFINLFLYLLRFFGVRRDE